MNNYYLFDNNNNNIKDNNNNNNNSDYHNNNNNEYNIKLYNSVFNNIYLKRIIFNHLNIFNILLPVKFEFKSIKDWQQFKYKEYLNDILLDFEGYDLNQLPDNIRNIAIPSPSDDSNIIQIINSIPNHVDSFRFIKELKLIDLNSIKSGSSSSSSSASSGSTINSISLSKLKSLIINIQSLSEKDIIPSSITKLDIIGTSYVTLKKNQIPNNIQVLKYDRLNSFEDGCLPESLTDVVFAKHCNPLIVNQFSTYGLINLEFRCTEDIGSNIKFPNTLQQLEIHKCSSFNATLPNGLKSFAIRMDRYEYEIQFPSSLEYLNINYNENILNQEVFKSRHSVPTNLKSLKITCSSIVDSNGDSILPDTLQSLNIHYFNQVIKENQLPSSLTHLKCESFDQAIDINVLPAGLETLILFGYSQVINPLAIPSNLKVLFIVNPEYDHPIKLTPTSHPNTIISFGSFNLYYDPSNIDTSMLVLPFDFKSLSKLRLQDKCKLKYLNVGPTFNYPIQLSDLPINNQIKTLELGDKFTHTINLEHFQNLESIIVHGSFTKITTTINDNGTYNYYNLKNIQISKSNHQFIKQLDSNFYKFITTII